MKIFGKLPWNLASGKKKGQKLLSKTPAKRSKLSVADPLKKELSPDAQITVVLAQCVDMQNPNSPTDAEVANALDVKCRVFLVEGIIAVFPLH